MKFSKILLATLLAVFAFISCSDDDPKVYNPNAGLRFDATIGEEARVNLRMAGASWDANDQIGVFMKKAGQGLSGNIVSSADNIKHTTPGDGKFSPAVLSEGIEYPEDGSNVDFIAYYPYTTPLTGYIYKVNVANQTSQSAIDLLYSNNAVNMNKNSAKNVGMTFTHELAKIVVNVEAGTGIGSLTGLVTTLTGTNTQADYALADGALTVSSSIADIQMLTSQSGIKMVSEAVILPAPASTGRTIVFTLGTQVFKWEVPATTSFEKGKRYTYDAVLSLDGVTFITPDATITDWVDIPGGSITPELQTGGDGSQSNPYTVSQVSGKLGETGKWVTGYIVGSTTKTRVVGTPSKDNILIAATATETDEAKCIPVDISSSAVKEYLDIIASPDLIGVKVKVQGDIVNNIFGNTLSMTNVVAQEGGKKGGGTTANLLFPGSDFEDWNAFIAAINSFGKKDYAIQSPTGGRDGSSALYINGTPAANDYVFTTTLASNITSNPTKIVFYVKGTAAKSLSINIYRNTTNTGYDVFNLGTYSSEAILEPAVINGSSGNGTNSYTGAIDTGGAWLKVTLDISTLDFAKTAGQNVFALKTGKEAAYDLYIDDITIE